MSTTITPTKSSLPKQTFNNITKPPEDDREYRGLELENGMKVLLISDKATERSAASMSVGVGHLSDPDEVPGLAHFLEHMLFLGTEKYPNENEYSTYLSTNGGHANAATYPDSTKYYFDVTPDKFEGALDRFAQFFIAPLYTESATEKEINAIDSEHQKNLQMDLWRIKNVTRTLTDKQHPYSKFGSGNKFTLWENTIKNNINIRQQLINFQDRWYSANIMGLSLLGKESLDELQQMVLDKFSTVVNKNIQAPKWDSLVYKNKPAERGLLVNITPVKDTRSFCLTFPCPDFSMHYRAAPDTYVAHLLGYEGEGSLLAELKRKGYANILLASYSLTARGFGFFDIMIDLTEEGMENVNEITKMCFQYIKLLRDEGPQKRIFDECHQLNAMQFRFIEKASPLSATTITSPFLHVLPMEDVISSGFFLTDWRPDLIDHVLSFLEPENMRVILAAKKVEPECDQVDKWYGTKYGVKPIENELLAQWANPEPNPYFHLPKPNPFIPTDFTLLPAKEDVTEHPVIIYDTEYIRVWHKQDDEFKNPKAILDFILSSPIVYSDPQNCNLTHLFVQLLLDNMNEYLYDAMLAGLTVNLVNTTYGVGVTVNGFNEKQKIYLEHIVDQIFNFSVDAKKFEIQKERYIRTLKNYSAEQPYKLAIYYLSVILTEYAWTKQELLESAKILTPDMLQRFVKQFLSKVHVEGFLYGNIDRAGAMALVTVVEEQLKKTYSVALPLLARQLFPKREYKLTNGSSYLYEKDNDVHTSSCILIYLQFGEQTDMNNIYTDLLATMLKEPFNSELRTKEQLGYLTFCSARKINGTQGLRALVQSSYPVDYVNERIEVFLEGMEKEIEGMPEETFQNFKDSLTMVKLEKPKKMAMWFSKYWSEIVLQEYHFNRAKVETDILKTITKDKLLAYYRAHVLAGSPLRKKLAVHIVSQVAGNTAKPEMTQSVPAKDGVLITDLSAFKSSNELYPIVQPHLNIHRKGGRSKL